MKCQYLVSPIVSGAGPGAVALLHPGAGPRPLWCRARARRQEGGQLAGAGLLGAHTLPEKEYLNISNTDNSNLFILGRWLLRRVLGLLLDDLHHAGARHRGLGSLGLELLLALQDLQVLESSGFYILSSRVNID